MPHKLLYLIDTLEVGGAEKSLLQMARRLDRERFEPVVCTLYPGEALRSAFQEAGIRVVCQGLPGKYQFAKAWSAFRRLAIREQPALIHTTLFRADQVGRAVGRWLGIPVISSLVNVPYEPIRLQANNHLSVWKTAVIRTADAVSARWVTQFHAVSAAVRDSACRHLRISPDRVTVIPRGRETQECLRAAPGQVAELRHALDVENAFPLVLNVGRLIAQKGQDTLIAAMRGVVDAMPRACLLIAGEGNWRSELERLIHEFGLDRHVRLLGHRDDVGELLALADCFAFPSRYEGLPGALVEAMLAARPVIASDIPMVREVLEPDVSGLVVPSESREAWTNGICSLALDPQQRQRLGEAAVRRARQQFDIRHVVRQIESLYERVIFAAGSRP